MWAGYSRYTHPSEAAAHNPILQRDWRHIYEETRSADDPNVVYMKCDLFDEFGNPITDDDRPERTIFKLETMGEQRQKDNLEDWRVLPLPRLSEDVQRNYFQCVYAVVNPYSKNKDLAVAFLEAAASDMLSSVNVPVFVLEDLSKYGGHYDMSVPVYRDMYEIFKDGAVVDYTFDANELHSLIDDYQAGRLTLDKVVIDLQRKADMWLGE
jgi:hypothetical protein